MIITTVKDLKEYLKNIPDDTIIITHDEDSDVIYESTYFDYRSLDKELMICCYS